MLHFRFRLSAWLKAFSGIVFSVVLIACQPTQVVQTGLTEAQIAELKAAGFVASDQGWEFSQSDKVLFASNVATLTAEAKQTIERVARVLLNIQIARVRVDGHTDAEGDANYNQQLSVRRANSVAEVLVQAGLPAASVSVRGRGKTAPVASNQTAAGRAQNRRVAIVVTTE